MMAMTALSWKEVRFCFWHYFSYIVTYIFKHALSQEVKFPAAWMINGLLDTRSLCWSYVRQPPSLSFLTSHQGDILGNSMERNIVYYICNILYNRSWKLTLKNQMKQLNTITWFKRARLFVNLTDFCLKYHIYEIINIDMPMVNPRFVQVTIFVSTMLDLVSDRCVERRRRKKSLYPHQMLQ